LTALSPLALEATGLGKRYRRTWALRDCTLGLPKGRIAALVGPNGAGKTTLLHLAVGLLAPTAGSIRVLGQTPGKDADLLARVGFVAQDAPLYGDFSGTELLRLGAVLNRRFDRALARDRLDRLGVPATGYRFTWLFFDQQGPVLIGYALFAFALGCWPAP
jgi:ABC-2 type transport system ATP-binding protein